MTIDIHICTRDRATELYGLLASLRSQEYQDFDIYVVDDASGNPIQNFYFINALVNRLRCDGHRVIILRNNLSKGICKARQQLVDYSMKHGRGDLICRLDDDTLVMPDYLNKLLDGIGLGYDLVSGVTPAIAQLDYKRETKFVKPIMNRIVLSEDGSFLMNGDDCGMQYDVDEFFLAHHFRSNALYRKSLHEAGINYDDIIALHGFREEEFFSIRAILAGFKLGVRTGAVAWHLLCPSGGERRPEIAQRDSLLNQQLLNRMVKKWYKQHGNFVEAYNQKHGVKEPVAEQLKNQFKPTNLIYSTED